MDRARDVGPWHFSHIAPFGRMSAGGTLLPRANPAACPQLAKADLASSSQHVGEGHAAFIAATVKTIVAQQRRCIWLKFLIGEPMSTRETPIAKHFVRQFGLRAGRRRERGKAEGEGEFFLHGTVPVRRELSKRGRLAHSAVCV
jgi:hypothetical protein